MIRRRQDFLGIVDDLAPSHLPPLPVGKLDQRHTGRLRKRDNLLMGEWGGGVRGAKSYHNEKTWSSINRSIFSVSKGHFMSVSMKN
jgi:hypothetical protein